LVLQWALAALVADRAVERVIDEQELHDAALRLFGDTRRHLRLDDHAVRTCDGTRGLGLGHALDLDEAHPTGRNRIKQGVIAETRNGDAELFGRTDDQRAFGDGRLDSVDDERDEVGARLDGVAAGGRCGDGHQAFTPANTVAATGS
jgi:hypothetical protein